MAGPEGAPGPWAAPLRRRLSGGGAAGSWIDGDTHAAPDQAACDSARTAWLAERCYKVIRFHAREVDRNLEGVLDVIRRACEARAAGGREEGERPSP